MLSWLLQVIVTNSLFFFLFTGKESNLEKWTKFLWSPLTHSKRSLKRASALINAILALLINCELKFPHGEIKRKIRWIFWWENSRGTRVLFVCLEVQFVFHFKRSGKDFICLKRKIQCIYYWVIFVYLESQSVVRFNQSGQNFICRTKTKHSQWSAIFFRSLLHICRVIWRVR